MSRLSEDTVSQLETFERQFDDIERQMRDIVASWRAGHVAPGKARTDLAQLEAKLDKIQCNGVDSIETYELTSGKDTAKALRKELTKRAELIHERMDQVFQELKASQPG